MFMPMSVNLKKCRFLVVGGGKIALKKVEKLLLFDAGITLVSPVIDHKFETIIGKLQWKTSRYDEAFLDDTDYVVAATNDRQLNQKIQADCHVKNIPCLNVSNGKESDFQIPAMVVKGPVHISISTQGLSPGMAKELRKAVEHWLDDEWVERTVEMAHLRDWIKDHIAEQSERQRVLRELITLPLEELKRRRQDYEDTHRDQGK